MGQLINSLEDKFRAGLPLREAVMWANAAAGIVVEKPGTTTVSWKELE